MLHLHSLGLGPTFPHFKFELVRAFTQSSVLTTQARCSSCIAFAILDHRFPGQGVAEAKDAVLLGPYRYQDSDDELMPAGIVAPRAERLGSEPRIHGQHVGKARTWTALPHTQT